MNRFVASLALVGLPAFVILAVGSTLAATVNVAANGEDGGVCGGKTNPCRTLTRAITNAQNGDTILVGPGRYGDVNGNGTLAGPDEEPVNVGCGCVVPVGKPVTMLSRDGAASTIIDAGNTTNAVMVISAGGVQFGKKNKGFTLTGSKAGNGAFRVTGDGNRIEGVVVTGAGGPAVVVSGSQNVISSSRVTNAGNDGFLVAGSDNTITESIAAHVPAIGFNIGGNRNALRKVVAIGNGGGMGFVGTGHSITSSAVLANAGRGIDIDNASIVITKTSILGNGTLESSNCGLGVSDDSTAVATGNFWGAPTGPGANPADAVCVNTGGTATTSPFTAKEIKIAPKALR